MNIVRYTCCFFIAFFMLLTSTLNAQNLGTISHPFDAGVFSRCESRSYSDHQSSMSTFNDNIGEPSKDAWYKFVLTDTVEISIDLCSSLVTDTRLYLLNSSYAQISSNDNYGPLCNSLKSSMKLTLGPGTYYAAMEGDGYGGPDDLTISINVVGQSYPIGSSIGNPIEAGSFGDCSGRSFRDIRNNSSSCYGNGVGASSNDIFYRLIITETREIEISHCESNFDTNIHLLNSSGGVIVSNNDNGPLCAGLRASIKITLQPGTYYVVSEGSGSSSGTIITNITAKPALPIGYAKENPVLAGEFSGCVERNYSDSRINSSCGTSGIYYKIEVLDDADLLVSTCTIGGYGELKVLNLSDEVIAFNDGNGPLCVGAPASLKVSLSRGTYLIKLLNSGFGSIDISVAPRMLAGSTINAPIDVGTLESGRVFRSTRDNSRCYGNDIGQASNDIYYKIVLSSASELSISHCGSTIDTYMHLLDASGNTIQVNNDDGPLCSGAAASMKVSLGAGTYYVVSEGFGNASGMITTSIQIDDIGLCTPLAPKVSLSENFKATYTPRKAFAKGTDLDQQPTCEVMHEVAYFDGLGRPKQTVNTKGSPTGKDIIYPYAYDALGRETLKFQPYTISGNNGAYRANALLSNGQAGFYNDPPDGVKATANPFSRTVFEPSPLNRTIESGAPGDAWQPIIGSNTGHTIKFEYGVNNAGDGVKLWTINTAGNGAISSGVYEIGKLFKNILKDENWKPSDGNAGTIEEFKDLEGRVVLKRNWENNTKSLSTYYIYDLFGNLRYVLPPAVNENGLNIVSFDETQTIFVNFIYGYHYDGKLRMIKKKTPGKYWQFMVYNKLDQVVLTQDAVQRNDGQWLFTKYDALGRIIVTGIYNNTADIVDMQTMVDGHAILWEERDNNNSSGVMTGYNNLAFPNTAINSYLTVNYYDDYDFFNNTFGQPNGTTQVQASKTKGLLTGTSTTVLGMGTKLLSVSYYDEYGRTIQIKSEHHLNNGHDVFDTEYDFDGNVKNAMRTHVNGSVSTTISMAYTYDHMGRRKTTVQSINGIAPTVLSALVYNEIGQLKNKKLHNGIQTTAFTYNERGWLKRSHSNQLDVQLQYNEGSYPQFNGNISSQSYTNGVNNTFAYQYDHLNRLLKGAATGMTEEISYDLMGNIKSLNRDNAGARVYNYTGNQLQDITSFTGLYQYDENGNAIIDGRNGVGLGYNYLNLPVTANKNGFSMTYTYDATGRKLKKVSTGTSTITTDYVGDIQYTNGNIDFIQTEEGIAFNSGSGYIYHYNLTDHLGNVRATFKVNGSAIEVIQRDDYYAFGMRKSGLNDIGAASLENRYLYNGKELQDELQQYDYGARFYDPVIGRWIVVDPLAEHSQSLTPYHYCSNNPMNRTDPDGKCDDPYCPHRETPDELNAGMQIGAAIVNGVRGLKTLFYKAFIPNKKGMKWQGEEIYKDGAYSFEMKQVPTEGLLKDMKQTAFAGFDAAVPLSMLKPGTTGVLAVNTETKTMSANSVAKAISSYEKNISEHTKKLKDYIADPFKFDNKGTLKNATKEIQEKIIAGRIKSLEKEIQKFKDNIEKLKSKNDK